MKKLMFVLTFAMIAIHGYSNISNKLFIPKTQNIGRNMGNIGLTSNVKTGRLRALKNDTVK